MLSGTSVFHNCEPLWILSLHLQRSKLRPREEQVLLNPPAYCWQALDQMPIFSFPGQPCVRTEMMERARTVREGSERHSDLNEALFSPCSLRVGCGKLGRSGYIRTQLILLPAFSLMLPEDITSAWTLFAWECLTWVFHLSFFLYVLYAHTRQTPLSQVRRKGLTAPSSPPTLTSQIHFLSHSMLIQSSQCTNEKLRQRGQGSSQGHIAIWGQS